MGAPVMHEDILDQLGMQIVEGEIPFGTVFTLADIVETFGVSRTVAREVMRMLETIGMVISKRRIGIVVTNRSEWRKFDQRLVGWKLRSSHWRRQLRTLTELRIAVEPVAASLAAVNATTDQRERLLELGRQLTELGEQGRGATSEYLALDVEFHTILLYASRNPMFIQLKGIVEEVLTRRCAMGLMPSRPVEESLEGHLAAAKAVANKQPQDAEAHMVCILGALRAELGLVNNGE